MRKDSSRHSGTFLRLLLRVLEGLNLCNATKEALEESLLSFPISMNMAIIISNDWQSKTVSSKFVGKNSRVLKKKVILVVFNFRDTV